MREPTRIVSTAVGSLGVAGVAWILAGCCGSPWLVAALGVSGAIAVSRFATAAPYLWWVVALLALTSVGWAFQPRRACADGTCERPTHWTVRALVVIALIAALALYFTPPPGVLN